VPVLSPTRPKLALLAWVMFLLAVPHRVSAQEEIPLGDVARSFRKNVATSDAVIDNDNFSKVMDDAETRRVAGSSAVFSLDPGEKTFHVSSPDVTCSLSFTAKMSAFSDPLLLDDLPRGELAKLDGPAMIDGDTLQVSMHNGTLWDLREVVIGLTIVKRPEPGETSSTFGQARIIPALAGDAAAQPQESFQKQPDVTLLLHVKGSAAPAATAVFRTPLNFALFPDQEWHWAIVKAKGIPPQTVSQAAMTAPDQNAGSIPPLSNAATPTTPSPSPAIPSPSNPQSPPGVPIH
jgi:hypothetical protein